MREKRKIKRKGDEADDEKSEDEDDEDDENEEKIDLFGFIC